MSSVQHNHDFSWKEFQVQKIPTSALAISTGRNLSNNCHGAMTNWHLHWTYQWLWKLKWQIHWPQEWFKFLPYKVAAWGQDQMSLKVTSTWSCQVAGFDLPFSPLIYLTLRLTVTLQALRSLRVRPWRWTLTPCNCDPLSSMLPDQPPLHRPWHSHAHLTITVMKSVSAAWVTIVNFTDSNATGVTLIAHLCDDQDVATCKHHWNLVDFV